MLARFLVLPATLLWTTDAFQPPQKRRLPMTRRLAPEEASVAVQAYADKATHQIATHIRSDQPFAALIPTDLLPEIDRDKNGKIDEQVRRKRERIRRERERERE